MSGKKTYLAAVAAVLSAAGGYLSGDITIAAAIQLAFTGILAATLRSGVASLRSRV